MSAAWKVLGLHATEDLAGEIRDRTGGRAGTRASPRLARDDDPLGVDTFATHRLPLAEAPRAYDMLQRKQDGAAKVLLTP